MKQGKEAKKGQGNTKSRKNNALAKKESESLKAMPKGPLMNVEDDESESKPKEDMAEACEETDEAEEKELDAEALKVRLEEKNRQAEEYYDRLLRTQAELENYKKRTDKELNEFRIYANAQLVKELLGVLDDFQTALASEEKGSNKTFMEGIELIYKNFYGMLEKEGLSMINPVKEKFDPWKHEAVEMVPTKEHPEHTVLGVIQPGYKFRDKILRPAKVRVATLPVSDGEQAEEEEELDKVEDKDKNTEKND